MSIYNAFRFISSFKSRQIWFFLGFLQSYDHPQVLAGQGTIALEIMEQVPHVDAILVPVGGGGLLAGVAVAVKGINPHIQVIVSPTNRIFRFSTDLKIKDLPGCLLLFLSNSGSDHSLLCKLNAAAQSSAVLQNKSYFLFSLVTLTAPTFLKAN